MWRQIARLSLIVLALIQPALPMSEQERREYRDKLLKILPPAPQFQQWLDKTDELPPDFDALPLGRFSWPALLLSSLLFGALHGRLWLAGTVAGIAFALAVYRRGALSDAVQAHATTNGLLMVYAIATGRWSVWS